MNCSTDDNTAMCHGKTFSEVRIKAEIIIDKMLEWCCENKMKANNDNFSTLFLTEMDL